MTLRRSAFVLALVSALTLGGAPTVSGNTGSIVGRVVTETNQPIANVAVVALRNGTEVSRTTSGTDGSYSLTVDAGSYSLRFTPPTRAHSSLSAFGITAPRTTPLVAQLTRPMPGRAFFSGTVALTSGETLASDTTVHFSGRQGSIGRTGTFRLTPTAGTTAPISLKGATNGLFAFQLVTTTSYAMNQDTVASFNVPVTTQRIRVMTADGTAVAGATVEAGHGQYGSQSAAVAGPEGLGNFAGTWYNRGTTDAQGWVTLTALRTNSPVIAGFRVTAPSGVPYLQQQFQQVAGNGDITLTMTSRVASLSGRLVDQSGAGLADAFIGYGNVSARTNVSGGFSRQVAAGTTGNFEIGYSFGSERTSGFRFNITPFSVPSRALDTSKSHTLAVGIDNVTVRVVDSSGLPVANAFVSLTDADGYAPRGTYRLLSDLPSFRATFSSNGLTNAQGVVQLRTLRLDREILGVVQVRPATNSAHSPALERAMVGAGTAVNVTLPRPTVSVTGTLRTSDGTPLTGSTLEFRDNQGNGGSSALAADGAYGMRVPVGMRALWSLGCGTTLARDLTVPLCVSFAGMLRTITAATRQDFVIPTVATTFTVVDPQGQPISGVRVRVSAGHDIVQCRPMAVVSLGTDATQLLVLASGTTGSNGVTQLSLVALSAPCKAEVTLTTPTNSRYQDRIVYLNVGAATDNVIVLSIPEPEIASIAPVSGASAPTVRLTGENFLGLISVTVDGQPATSFRVVNSTTVDVVLPAGVTSGIITVENGGGQSSITLS